MVTLKDIARVTGVSTATVSYVVNNSPRPMLAETRDRVMKAVEELGYRPNAAARSLMGKRTHTFGVIFPSDLCRPFDNQYYAAVLAGIVDEASVRKQIVMLFTGMTWHEAERNVPLFSDGRCDGFLFISPPLKSQLVSHLAERNTPLVLIGTRAMGTGVATVDADNVEGSRIATSHLIDLGHRRIAFLYHNDGATTSNPERLEGYRKAMQEHGLPVADDLVCLIQPGESEREATLRLLLSRRGSSISGIVCCHDSTAAYAIDAARSIGRRIPKDLSVIGFDDLPMAANHVPGITTIQQPLRQIGASAAAKLFDMIDDRDIVPSESIFDVHLVERGSTAPQRRRR